MRRSKENEALEKAAALGESLGSAARVWSASLRESRIYASLAFFGFLQMLIT